MEASVLAPNFFAPISELKASFDGDQLLIGAIFNSIGDEIKSLGKLKLSPIFHIKKRDKEVNFEKYFSDE